MKFKAWLKRVLRLRYMYRLKRNTYVNCAFIKLVEFWLPGDLLQVSDDSKQEEIEAGFCHLRLWDQTGHSIDITVTLPEARCFLSYMGIDIDEQ